MYHVPSAVLDTGHPLLKAGETTQVFGDQQEARMLRAERKRGRTEARIRSFDLIQ